MKTIRVKLAPVREIFGIDLRTLALFRILLGVYILIDLCFRSRDLLAHYTDSGLMPRAVQMEFLYLSTWSIHLANGSAWFQALLFLLAAFLAILLILGWRTRLVTALSWLLMLSVQNRNTFILSGEDNLALLLLFWAMFLPLGARYSADCAVNRSERFSKNAYFSIATFALLIQGMSMYFFSALLKTHPIWVPEGTAVYYALHLDYLVTPFALWFRQFEPMLTGLTYYVYVLELVGPFLIFSPLFHRTLRTLFMLAFITMHLAFLFFLEIGFFPFVSIIMNLTFMPGWMWDKLDGWLPRRTSDPVGIWFDRGCDFCEKTCHLLAVFLFLRTVPVKPAQDDPDIGPELESRNSWVLTVGNKRFFKFNAIVRLFGLSPVFFPVAWILDRNMFHGTGDRFYDWIGKNRPLLSRMTGGLLQWRDTDSRFGPMTQSIAAVFLIFITLQNISTLAWSGLNLPSSFLFARQALGLYQNWTMFAPYPEMTSPWPVIEGELSDGTIVDVYRMQKGLADFDKPAVVSEVYANYRWRKFLSILEDRSYDDAHHRLALNYGRFLCRTWSAKHPDSPALSTFVIYFQTEPTPLPGGEKEISTRQIWNHDCLNQ
ncbi:MAG: HTTM domain-containing protein [Roseibium sp.]|uniref:HTTM domain-containing protein n=1 Tax=Roseibium sp. TaxID=1936156 RepID=UPI00263684E2|nr:HTTM domain-containing protein [Roseibium sp.]MCV0424928.1 HTTM domain-containing protein [Roseibium sp.]